MKPRTPHYRPRPTNPAPYVVGALLCLLLVATFYWLAVLRPAAEHAAREADRIQLEQATQRAIDARARALQTHAELEWVRRLLRP